MKITFSGSGIVLYRRTILPLRQADFLLFNLGWDQCWGSESYFGDYPCLDDEVMDYILKGKYKGIGFDVIGLDPIADVNLTRHKKLFAEKEIVNIENLCHLEQCGSGLFWFSCFPLKIKNSDGSPIRAIAWFE
ncbi:MAG: cyclase family protein [Lachnospiraceae bacterium]